MPRTCNVCTGQDGSGKNQDGGSGVPKTFVSEMVGGAVSSVPGVGAAASRAAGGAFARGAGVVVGGGVGAASVGSSPRPCNHCASSSFATDVGSSVTALMTTSSSIMGSIILFLLFSFFLFRCKYKTGHTVFCICFVFINNGK